LKSLISDLILLAHALIVRPQLLVSKNPEKPKKVSVDLTGHTYDGRCERHESIDVLVFVVLDIGTGLQDVIRMAHTVTPPPRCTAATLELTHKGNINDKTITERDREVRDFNGTLLASAIARIRHLVFDTHRTDLSVTQQACHYIHEMIVTVNRTCVLLASEDMITQRIDTHLSGAKRATLSVGKHLRDGRS